MEFESLLSSYRSLVALLLAMPHGPEQLAPFYQDDPDMNGEFLAVQGGADYIIRFEEAFNDFAANLSGMDAISDADIRMLKQCLLHFLDYEGAGDWLARDGKPVLQPLMDYLDQGVSLPGWWKNDC